MPRFARLNADLTLRDIIDIAQATYDALAGNPKQALLRPLTIDVQPVPLATQVVDPGPIVIEPTQARQTWALRLKTLAEIERDALAVELQQIDLLITDLQTQRDVTRATWDGYTAAQLRAEQWRDRQALLRLAVFAARRIRRGM